eukprot:scaffold295645_cov27-Tisochrysis_lutea.AAC.4
MQIDTLRNPLFAGGSDRLPKSGPMMVTAGGATGCGNNSSNTTTSCNNEPKILPEKSAYAAIPLKKNGSRVWPFASALTSASSSL